MNYVDYLRPKKGTSWVMPLSAALITTKSGQIHFLSHASVCCLEHNKEWSDSTRKLRESYWIRRLNTLFPFGINNGDWLYLVIW